MNEITVSAKTYDEAITKALIQLETTSEHLKVNILEQGSNGFLGILGGRPWTISARVKTEEEEAEEQRVSEQKKKEQEEKKEECREKKPEENKEKEQKEKEKREKAKGEKVKNREKTEPETEESNRKRRPKKERPHPEESKRDGVGREVLQEEAEKIKEAAIAFLSELFRMMDTEVQIETDFNYQTNELKLDLSGDDMGIMIGKRGQTLDSLQYLVSLVVNKHRDVYIHVKLDTENYRERREQKLRSLARNIAGKVKQTRKPIALEPMNPYERRVIHSALQRDPYVTTISEGEDPYRHIVVLLKKNPKKKSPSREDL